MSPLHFSAPAPFSTEFSQTLVVCLLAYFAGVLLVARLFARKVEDLRDYFLAGRSLGALPVAIAFTASWFGASSTVGSVNAFHDMGLSGLWQLILPSVLSCLLITFVMARRVADQQCLSQPEAVSRHYGPLGRFLLAIIILASATTFIGSQLVAVGQLFETVLHVDRTVATVAMISLVATYAMMGGYFAVVVTDTLQFTLVTAALLVLAGFVVLGVLDAPPQALPALVAAQPAAHWDFWRDWQHNVFLVLTFVLGWMIAPEMWQRMSSTRDRNLAFRGAALATGFLFLLFALVFVVGLASPLWVGESRTVLVDLAGSLPSPALTAFVLVGIIAAIGSTTDSALNVGSLALTQDIYRGFIRPAASARELVLASRIATALVAVPGTLIALRFENLIQVLWISADIYASTMFFPVMGMLFLREPGRWSGVLAMVFGGVAVAVSALVQYGGLVLPVPWPGWPQSTLLGVAMSGLGFGLGYWLGLPRSAAEAAGRRTPPGVPVSPELTGPV